MMRIKYKGESYGKKIARAMFWLRAAEWLGMDRFLRSTHMVLASQEGGDISVLKALGCQPKNIIAVDINPAAAEQCREKHPDVEVRCGNVAEVVKDYRRALGVLFLDFCGKATPFTLGLSARAIVNGLPRGAIFGINLLRSREQGDIGESISLYRSISEGSSSAYLKAWEAQRDAPRCYVVEQELQKGLTRFGVGIRSVDVLSYHSRTDDGGGSPMLISSFIVYRDAAAGAKSAGRLSARAARFRDAARPRSRPEWSGLLSQHSNVGAPPIAVVVEYAARLRKAKLDAAGILNISPARAAAWFAHVSRGTYGADRDRLFGYEDWLNRWKDRVPGHTPAERREQREQWYATQKAEDDRFVGQAHAGRLAWMMGAR